MKNPGAEEAIENKRAEDNKRIVEEVYGSGEIKFTDLSAEKPHAAVSSTQVLLTCSRKACCLAVIHAA